MSFILEALNKAERDQSTHAGHAIPLPQAMESNSKRQWLMVFLISIAGSALVLGVYLALNSAGIFSKEQSVATVTTPKQAAPIKNSTSVVSAPHIEKQPKAVIQKAAVSPEITTKNNNSGSSRLSSLVGKPRRSNSTSVTESNVQSTPDQLKEIGSEVTLAAAKPPTGRVVYLPDSKKKPASPGQYNNVPILHNLPESIRAQLPALELNVHVFSDNPAKRFVYINSVRYSEGAQIGSDIILEEIISSGVVLNYQGTFFRIVIES